MTNLEIKKATQIDITLLQWISTETFSETFAKENSVENMHQYLTERFNLEKLAMELNNPNSFFYLAIVDNKPVAYMKINLADAQSDIKDITALEIERIYVLKSFQGNKIGQLLIEQAMNFAKMRNKKYIWLGVWENNFSAIKFYQKNGFTHFDNHIFLLGEDEQIDWLMKLEI